MHNGEHIKFDLPLLIKTATKAIFTFQFKQAVKLLKLHKQYPMKKNIVAYEIMADNKKIFLMGSADNIKEADIPKDIDVLVLPYQGKSNICSYSLKLVGKIKPKTITLTHFDNAYPPMTSEINTDKFVKKMNKKYPDIKVIKPEFGKAIKI